MVNLSQRLSRSGALTSACSPRARWTRTVVFLQSCDRSQCCDLMTFHRWLKPKVIRTVLHAHVTHFLNCGSGAMGSRFREQLTHWTDAAVFTQPDQWTGFQSAMVTAHEADFLKMRNFLEEITKNKYNQGRLALKDLKPDTFESNEKSKLSF